MPQLKTKQQGTQDFFPKKANNQKTKGFMFNAAPLNKNVAKEEIKDDIATKDSNKQGKNKRSAFMAKLYEDEDAFDDEMKVFDMNAALSDDDQEESKTQKIAAQPKKRDDKAHSKKPAVITSLKVNRLKFSVGSLGLFAVSEVHSNYLIVNFTRNTKGYVSLDAKDEHKPSFTAGQFIVAAVTGMGTTQYNMETSRNRNKKLQLTLALEQVNKSLTSTTVVKNMILQGQIVSKEAKGYLVNFGLKDKAKGFLSSEQDAQYQIGQLVHVVVTDVLASSKIIKCQIGTGESGQKFLSQKELTIHNIKPGFLVNGKISRLLENGLEVNFLGGFTGSVFIDHIDRESLQKYGTGEKIIARVISVDPQTQTISLSLLPHIVNLESVLPNLQEEGVEVGKTYENTKIKQSLYGGSYKVQISKTLSGFLHKTHTLLNEEQEAEESEEENLKKKKNSKKAKPQKGEYERGQKLEKVRVKEINYFDGVPILSLKEEVVNASALNYENVKCGDFLKGTITAVFEEKRCIEVSINEFVKGRLYLEHMADYPLKVLPPKLKEVGKLTTVRVFSVDEKSRSIEFTKKETLMKAKTPVFQSYKEVQKGVKLVGLVVATNEYGYVIKSFGGIKALLTFTDIKQSGSGETFKIGSIVKAYVLFKKKDQGMALTLDKVKAKELRKQNKQSAKANSNGVQTLRLLDALPKDEELTALKDKYKPFSKFSNDQANVGKVMQFRVLEQDKEDYLVCKSIDQAKKSQNIVALLPKSLIKKHHLPSFSFENFTFDGIILEIIEEQQFPLISAQIDLIALKATIPRSNEELKNQENRVFTGVVSELSKSGVQVLFLDGLKKQILVKDLETTQDFESVYHIGKVVRTAFNKKERLTLKKRVIYLSDRELLKQDKVTQIKSLYASLKEQFSTHEVKVGEEIRAQVNLVKEYGLILSAEKYPGLTGFILNEHTSPNKTYKEGQLIVAKVLDIDFDKDIIDLSERLITSAKAQSGKSKAQLSSTMRATVQLNKEDYLIVTFKGVAGHVGILQCQGFNSDETTSPNEAYSIGDELDVEMVEQADNGFVLCTPVIPDLSAKTAKTPRQATEIQIGNLVKVQVKSKTTNCVFMQLLGGQSQLQIGRLHRMECASNSEFEVLSLGQVTEAKVLKVSEGGNYFYPLLNIIDHKRIWIELTRRSEHMQKTQGLDQQFIEKQPQAIEDLKDKKLYDAIVTEVNFGYSQPVQVALSPFVKGNISFDNLVTPDILLKEGSSYLQKFKPGMKVKVNHNNGIFSLEGVLVSKSDQTKETSKGEKYIVRFVKAVSGKGITVQINQNTFGFIQISEITDQIVGCVFDYQVQNQPLFVARVIGKDKTNRPQLSSRESVVDDQKWALIQGQSIHFQKADEKSQLLGNQRNKILKFGAGVALQQGDLCLGYVTNIGKSGCFIQIGQDSTGRSGLNELSDNASFDFKEQMPIGRMILARVVKIEEHKTGDAALKRFNLSCRRTLVVHGTNTIDRASLQVGEQVHCVVVAIADGKAFAQIKGSYLKLKVKNFPSDLTIGNHMIATLAKVTKQKITGTFTQKVSAIQGMSDIERKIGNLWQLIEEESQKDIEAQKLMVSQTQVDSEVFAKLGGAEAEDEVDRQVRDLKELEVGDEEMVSVQGDDSDEEEMQRIIKQSKAYKEESEDEADDDEEEAEDMEDEDQEEGEDSEGMEDDDGIDSSDDDKTKKKTKSGKQSLKIRMQEEKAIRKREQQLRENKDQPQTVEDFERMLVSNQDQSYVWIQYMAFMLDNLGAESARKVVERAVKNVSISNEEDKYNLWIAFMNLENSFGTQDTLEKVVKRALEVNDRKKVYLQLISIYKSSHKYQYIEDIYKQLCKKFNTSLKIWSGYLEFLFEMREMKASKESPQAFLIKDMDFAEPKQILQRSLQSLPKDKHVNIISKFGMLEFKHGHPESGRTMFEGIITNFPKRMDIWAIYMDMESKYCGENKQQARHLFERCLTNEMIQKKPKKMKLVFQKYMEFETVSGNKKNIEKLKKRVMEYLEKAYDVTPSSDDE